MPSGSEIDRSPVQVLDLASWRSLRPRATTVNFEGESEPVQLPPHPEVFLNRMQIWARKLLQDIHTMGLQPDGEQEGDLQYTFGNFQFVRANTDPRFTSGFEAGDLAFQLDVGFPEPTELLLNIEPKVITRAIDQMTANLKQMADQGELKQTYAYRRLMIGFERLKASLGRPDRKFGEGTLGLHRLLLKNFKTACSETPPGHPVICPEPSLQLFADDLSFFFRPDAQDPRRMTLQVTVNALPSGSDTLLTSEDLQINHQFGSYVDTVLGAFEENFSAMVEPSQEQEAHPVKIHLRNIREEAKLLLGELRKSLKDRVLKAVGRVL